MNHDLDIPKGLSTKGKLAAKEILKFLKEKGLMYTGGCKAFYSPKEWEDRGEIYGTTSELIVCHDGGDLTSIFDLDHGGYDLHEELLARLHSIDVMVEQCTSWHSAVYKI